MKKLKVVQIGIGHDHAPAAFETMCRLSDRFEVVGYAPVGDEAERPLMNVYKGHSCFTPEQALDIPGLDAVCVETDDWNLTEYALKALERGLPVEMDKPGSPSHEEFRELCAESKRSGVPLQVGYMYRYNPMISETIRDAKEGRLGVIHCVEAHMDCIHIASKRQWLDHFKGGMLYYLGCHLIDLIVQILGVPEEITPHSISSGLDGVTAEDIGMAVLRYKNAISFAKTSACELGGFQRRQLVVCGTERTVELNPLEECVSGGQVTRKKISSPEDHWHGRGIVETSPVMDRYEAMFTAFAGIAAGERSVRFTPEYEEQLHRIILAACGEKIDYKEIWR